MGAKSKMVLDETSNISLSPKKLVRMIKLCYISNQPLFIWGPPGIGKSAIVRDAQKELGIGLIDFRALMRDVVDLNGIPQDVDGYTSWLRPRAFPQDGSNWHGEDKGFYFLDELNAAVPMMQAACYQVVHERYAGEHKMRDGWVPIAAGNYDTDGAVTSRMPTPLKSRFIHANIEITPNETIKDCFRLKDQSQWAEDWVEWAYKAGIDPLIIAYIRGNNEALYMFNKTSQTFPCQRTWEFMSNILKQKPDSDLLYAAIAGTIGREHAPLFYAYMRNALKLPDIDAIIKDPEKVVIPKEASMIWATITQLALKACDPKVFKKVVKYYDRLDAEWSVIAVKDCWERNNDLSVKCDEFISWGQKHSDLIIRKKEDEI